MRLASEYSDFYFLIILAHFHIEMSERLVIAEEDCLSIGRFLLCVCVCVFFFYNGNRVLDFSLYQQMVVVG